MVDLATLTPNPNLDRVAVASLSEAAGLVVRVTQYLELPGGKGLHAAHVASQLGLRATAVAPLGGTRGKTIERLAQAAGIDLRSVCAQAETRGSYTIIDPPAARELTFIEPSGPLNHAEVAELWSRFSEVAEQSGMVALGGSLPDGLDASAATEFILLARAAGALAFVDTSGEALLQCLDAEPDLVKPNLTEALTALGGDPSSRGQTDSLVEAGRALVARGARSAVVTGGPLGACLVTGGQAWLFSLAAQDVVNSVGCGDAMFAGIAAGLAKGHDLLESTRVGMAAAVDKLSHLHTSYVNATRVWKQARCVECRRVPS